MNTYVLIRLLMFLSFIVNWGNAQNQCVDCSSIISQNCVVNKTGMGYMTKAPRDKLLIAKLGSGEEPDPDFEKCINPEYKLLGKLSTFVCFWSPKLKCQAVAEKSYLGNKYFDYKTSVCASCAIYCGCEFSHGFPLTTDNVHILIINLGLFLCLCLAK